MSGFDSDSSGGTAMTLGLCYWILMLIWLVWGALTHLGYGVGYGAVNVVLLFFLFVLLGWQVFGAPLRRG
jgi:uncharacterized membrane protein